MAKEISLDVLKSLTGATFTNPSLLVLANHSKLHPFELIITGGSYRILWRGK